MSLELERGKKPTIEMPPLPPEEVVQSSEASNSPQEMYTEPVEQQVANIPSSYESQEAAPLLSEKNQEEVSRIPAEPVRETAQAKNFRELREKGERTARERDDLAQQVKELRSKIDSKEDFNLSPDDLVEGKHIAQIVKEQREMKQKIQQYEQQTAQQRQLAQAESNLKQRYNDFDKVVNENTIVSLKEKFPQTAEAIAKLANDPEAAFDYAYMAIKMNNLAPQAPKHDQDAVKAQQNASKPRPLNSVSAQHSESPIARMNAFANGEVTKEIQAQMWKEMNDARKGY